MRSTMRSGIALLTGLVLLGACGEELSSASPSSVATEPRLTSSASTDSSPASTVSSVAQSSLPAATTAGSTVPTTSMATVGSLTGAVINTANPSLFGQVFFVPLNLDTYVGSVSETLGPVTWDTGWQPMPAEYVCTGSESFRTLWWGDLRLTFETGPGAGETQFTAWSLGDPSISTGAPLGPPPSSTEPATGITTGEGIGIGTPLKELEAALGDRPFFVIDNRVDIPGALVTSFLLDNEQRVKAIGSGRTDCIDESRV